MDNCLAVREILVEDSCFSMQESLLPILSMFVRLMLCVITSALNPWAQKYPFDGGQSSEFPLAKTVIVPGKKGKSCSRRDEQHGMSRWVIDTLLILFLVNKQ